MNQRLDITCSPVLGPVQAKFIRMTFAEINQEFEALAISIALSARLEMEDGVAQGRDWTIHSVALWLSSGNRWSSGMHRSKTVMVQGWKDCHLSPLSALPPRVAP